ncbi:hypothetical protein [Microbacterium sp. A1-JK]|uniref:hypothetical protein n=1 Tax=Microbacterium sp. A1-JK TaxID=3177516 RepID=UPI003888F07C
MSEVLRVDDMTAHPVSDDSYVVMLGDSTSATLGRVWQVHQSWWAAFRFHAVVDEYGNYYGDSAPPELIAMVPSLEDAVRAYGPQT